MPSNNKNIVQPDYWEEAVSQLKKKDRILRKVIPLCEDKVLLSPGPPFLTLVRLILAQQISVKAAATVWNKFINLVGESPSPNLISMISDDLLRNIGVSKRKIDYLKDLANYFNSRGVCPEKWLKMDDESIISELSRIRGVGRWTAEMFLIFNMQRPDIMPLDDFGLLKAISTHYFSGEPVSRFEAREVSVAWRPWRTVATWYLWRSIE
ncbi:MAG: DNA-3-methyladenine glycosylase 2 family protein [Candidatus Kinetoplastibacterium crithidii]|nr:DNA-3-methyladenine glycosylase 2 family protein [Candidatus Kinetoplastibacterium crithidii]